VSSESQISIDPKPSRMKSSILSACCNLVALCALVLHTTARTEAAEELMPFSYGRRSMNRIVEGLVHDNMRQMKKSSTASSKDSSTKSSKHKSSKSSKTFSSKSDGKGHGTHHSSSKTSKSNGKSKGKGGKGKGGKKKGKGSHDYVDGDDSFSAGGSPTDDSSLKSSSSFDPSNSLGSGSGDGYGSVSSTGTSISNAPVLSSVSAPSGSPVASPPSSKPNKIDNVVAPTVGSITSKSPSSKGSGKGESSGGKQKSPKASSSATYAPSSPVSKSSKIDNVVAPTVGSVPSKSPTTKGSGKGESSGGKVSNGVTSAPSIPSGPKSTGKNPDSGKGTASSSPSPNKPNGKKPTKDKAGKSTSGASSPSMPPSDSSGSGSHVDGRKTSYPSSAPSLSPGSDSSLPKSHQPKGKGDKSISHATKISPSASPSVAEQSDTDSRIVNVMVCADEYETADPNEYSVPVSFTYSCEISGGDTDLLPELEEKILMVAAESMLACSTRRDLNYSNQSGFRKHDRIQYFDESASTKYSHSRIRQLKELGGKDVAKGEKDGATPKGKQDDSAPKGASSEGAIVKFMSSPTDHPSITQTCEPKEDSSNTCTIVIAGMTFVQTNAEGSDENASLLLQTIQDSMRNGELLSGDIPNLVSVDYLGPEPHSKSLEEVGLQDEDEDKGTLAIGFAFVALACAILIAIAVVRIQKFRNAPTPKDDAASCDKACEVLDDEISHGGQTRDLEVLSIQCSTVQCCSSEESTGFDNSAYREPNVNTPGTVHSTMDVHHCSSSTCNLCRQHDRSPTFIRVDDFDDSDDDEGFLR